MERDIIVGIHSIAHAIENPRRTIHQLVATEEGIDNLRKMGQVSNDKISKLPVQLVSSHKLQEEGKKLLDELGFNYTRIPSGAYLITNPIEIEDPSWIMGELDSGRHLKILCLDSVTDVHNAAAIMRTSAFYDVNCLVVSSKNNFGLGPSFARIASGALEYVKVVRCASLPKFLSNLKKRGIRPIGLTEHTEDTELPVINGTRCLVMGAEDKGLSNAVARVIDDKIRLSPKGKIESLNVSVAAALAMEKVF